MFSYSESHLSFIKCIQVRPELFGELHQVLQFTQMAMKNLKLYMLII